MRSTAGVFALWTAGTLVSCSSAPALPPMDTEISDGPLACKVQQVVRFGNMVPMLTSRGSLPRPTGYWAAFSILVTNNGTEKSTAFTVAAQSLDTSQGTVVPLPKVDQFLGNPEDVLAGDQETYTVAFEVLPGAIMQSLTLHCGAKSITVGIGQPVDPGAAETD
ncbi:hypothetical protein HBE99_07605 [Mycobacteroides chelonae]|uniref:hypothetical protein n=1 Tax=Mycobacteroides chelonae TaxID=1774 RepID=UPI0019105718|nr:hypothetical protein [Mycobacteroides chelonae]QQG96724.1 hypothetical protein HBE99_07605 [Mycobacteroides chelonae]